MKRRTKLLAGLLAVTCSIQQIPVTIHAAEITNSPLPDASISVADYKEATSDEVTLDDAAAIDQTDSDGDGIIDYWEIDMGTNPSLADTDKDGVSDYDEIYVLGTDPLLTDTDGNGISDADEDFDGDGLSNQLELSLHTNPLLADTDADGLSDSDEYNIYHTNPVNADSDGDGASDGFEVTLGTNPLEADENFQITVISEDGHCTLNAVATGEVAESVRIETVSNPLEGDTLYSYSSVYQISASGDFIQGTLTFHDTTVYSVDEPTIYQYNAENETAALNELLTSVIGNHATTFVTSAGKYVLKSKTEIVQGDSDASDSVTDSDVTIIKAEKSDSTLQNTDDEAIDLCPEGAVDSNLDGISDDFTKLLCDGTILTGSKSKVFGDATYKEVQSSDDFDADSLLNGAEVHLYKSITDDSIYAVLSSSPISLDTDSDGIYDADDTAPFDTGLADGIVGSLRIVGRHSPDAIFLEGHSYLVYTSYINDQDITINNIYSSYAFNKDFKDAVLANENLLSWNTTVSELTEENADYRMQVASELFPQQADGEDTTIELDHGEYVSIGNYTMTSYAQSVLDAVLGSSESGTLMEMAVLKAIYNKLTGEDVGLSYIMTHLAQIVAKISAESYLLGEDVLDGNTDGGIWMNREMFNQKYQYTQCPNQIYEIEITQKQLDDMLAYYDEHSYYSVLSHNCSTVAVGAWNTAVGYETNEAGELVESPLYLNARASGALSIFDLPAAVCESIQALSTREDVAGTYVGQNIPIVKGCDVATTVNQQVNHFDVPDDLENEDSDDSGNDDSGDSGNEGSDDSGNAGSGDSGNDGSDDSENEGSGDSGNEGSDDSGNNGSGDSGNDGSDDSENEGSDDSGNNGSGDSGNNGSGDSGNEGSDDSGNNGSGDSGNNGSNNSGNGNTSTDGNGYFSINESQSLGLDRTITSNSVSADAATITGNVSANAPQRNLIAAADLPEANDVADNVEPAPAITETDNTDLVSENIDIMDEETPLASNTNTANASSFHYVILYVILGVAICVLGFFLAKKKHLFSNIKKNNES